MRTDAINHRSRLTIVVGVTAALLTAAIGPARGDDVPVALQLLLAVDVSASVDSREFDLQMTGIAGALRDPSVVKAIQAAGATGIAVAVVQWAGPFSQEISVGWTHLRAAASIGRFADRVESAPRLFQVEETAIARLIYFAVGSFDGNGFAGRRRVIDVSGDGPNNYGGPADATRDWAVAAGITVNGLAVLSEHVDVVEHYRNHVIGGDGAFLVRAAGYEDFARAMGLKLLREIEGRPLAGAALAAPDSVPSVR